MVQYPGVKFSHDPAAVRARASLANMKKSLCVFPSPGRASTGEIPFECVKDSLEKQGFYFWQRFLGCKTLRAVRENVEKILQRLHHSVDPEWVQNLHQVLEPGNWILRLACHSKIVSLVTSVLGGPVYLYSTQVACRLPAKSSAPAVTPFHQDAPGARVITLWIALDRIESKNGGLQFVLPWFSGPWPRLDFRPATQETLELSERMMQHNVFAVSLPTEYKVFSYRLRAGGAGLHSSSIPHGSGPNQSSSPRRVLIFRYMHRDELAPSDKGKFLHFETGTWLDRQVYDVTNMEPCYRKYEG